MIGLGNKGDAKAREQILEKLSKEADAGRRLAIYDRETGLYAHWYLQRRFADEAKRADRYSRPLSVIVVEVPQADGFRSRDQMTEYLGQRLRGGDIASHLGDGRYFVYLPETEADDAERAAERIRWVAPNVATGIAAYGSDGEELLTLQSIAEVRLEDTRRAEAALTGRGESPAVVDLRPFREDEAPISAAV